MLCSRGIPSQITYRSPHDPFSFSYLLLGQSIPNHLKSETVPNMTLSVFLQMFVMYTCIPETGESQFSEHNTKIFHTVTSTFHTSSGDQGRSQRTERVKGFSQQPLLPVASHLPIAGADIVGHCESCHM